MVDNLKKEGKIKGDVEAEQLPGYDLPGMEGIQVWRMDKIERGRRQNLPCQTCGRVHGRKGAG